MGPHLALDASSTGDSYFVKMKLKSIYNTRLREGTRQCHAALEVSRLSVSPQTYFQRFIYQLKKRYLAKVDTKDFAQEGGLYQLKRCNQFDC